MRNKIFIFVSKTIISVFYKKEYLSGKWFENNVTGWKWAWRCLWDQKIKGYNKHIPFPVNPTTTVGNINNLKFDISNIDNFWKTGIYYQCWTGKITIGKGTWIAQNVGIITENHNPVNLNEHLSAKDVVIGSDCWIGMNAVIMPGVELGDNTIVGANSVVTHSFKEGHCVIVGAPAVVVKKLDSLCGGTLDDK